MLSARGKSCPAGAPRSKLGCTPPSRRTSRRLCPVPVTPCGRSFPARRTPNNFMLLRKESAWWSFLSIITLGTFLRFFHLGTYSLWLDEFLNFFDATHAFREMYRIILASPPLFHYVVRCFYLVFGKNDFWLRF